MNLSSGIEDVFLERLKPLSADSLRALIYLDFPASHQLYIKSTNMLKRLFKEGKRKTRVVGVFPSERSLTNLATAVMLRTTENWNFRRYMDMSPLWTMKSKPTKFAT